MNAYAQQDYSLFSRRTLAFVLIVGVHGVLILVLANGLAHGFIKVIPKGMEIGWVPEAPKNQPPPPLPPPPKFSPREIKLPPTEVKVDVSPDEGNTLQMKSRSGIECAQTGYRQGDDQGPRTKGAKQQ